jgi:hypothetical protein
MSDPSPSSVPREPIPLEAVDRAVSASGERVDRRPRIPEPLPVRLVAVEDVRLPGPIGVDEELDAFYAGLLLFERVGEELAYRADNFILRFELADRPVVHESLRPLGIEVLSLAETEKRIIDAELEYTRQRGVTPGSETLLLLDPAGNWIEVGEIRLIG